MKNPYVRIVFTTIVNSALSILLMQFVLPIIGIKISKSRYF
ncbi:hypothetical protein ACLM5H_16350 [Fredinandcohnia humi]